MAPIIDDPDRSERRAGVRRTAILCAIVALAFYLGFILIGILRA